MDEYLNLMSIKNVSQKVEGDLSKIMNPQNIVNIMNSSDIIGVVLRIHFGLESALDYWCNKITHNDDFFDFGFIGFDKKLSIAKKLGLPEYLCIVFKQFNKIRNSFAHQASPELDLQQLNSIKDKITLIDVDHLNMPDLSDGTIYLNGQAYKWDEAVLDTKQRISILYMTFGSKLIYIFGRELTRKNIYVDFKY